MANFPFYRKNVCGPKDIIMYENWSCLWQTCILLKMHCMLLFFLSFVNNIFPIFWDLLTEKIILLVNFWVSRSVKMRLSFYRKSKFKQEEMWILVALFRNMKTLYIASQDICLTVNYQWVNIIINFVFLHPWYTFV